MLGMCERRLTVELLGMRDIVLAVVDRHPHGLVHELLEEWRISRQPCGPVETHCASSGSYDMPGRHWVMPKRDEGHEA